MISRPAFQNKILPFLKSLLLEGAPILISGPETPWVNSDAKRAELRRLRAGREPLEEWTSLSLGSSLSELIDEAPGLDSGRGEDGSRAEYHRRWRRRRTLKDGLKIRLAAREKAAQRAEPEATVPVGKHYADGDRPKPGQPASVTQRNGEQLKKYFDDRRLK